MSEHYQVSVTTPSPDEAAQLAKMAVASRLAASAHVAGPITSTYWWDGSITTSTEWVCVLKTTAELVSPLSKALRAAHSYEVPEIINIPIGGHRAYLEWIDEVTTGPTPSRME